MSASPQILHAIFPNYHLGKLKVISNLYLNGHTFVFYSQTEKLVLYYVTIHQGCIFLGEKGVNSDKEILKLDKATHWQKLFLRHVLIQSAIPPLNFFFGNACFSRACSSFFGKQRLPYIRVLLSDPFVQVYKQRLF